MIKRLRLPRTKPGRIALGIGLILGGCLAVLPVFGLWMIPLGLWVLSEDFATVRRFRRRWTVRLGRWAQTQPWIARLFNRFFPNGVDSPPSVGKSGPDR